MQPGTTSHVDPPVSLRRLPRRRRTPAPAAPPNSRWEPSRHPPRGPRRSPLPRSSPRRRRASARTSPSVCSHRGGYTVLLQGLVAGISRWNMYLPEETGNRNMVHTAPWPARRSPRTSCPTLLLARLCQGSSRRYRSSRGKIASPADLIRRIIRDEARRRVCCLFVDIRAYPSPTLGSVSKAVPVWIFWHVDFDTNL